MDYDTWLTNDPALSRDPDEPEPPSLEDLADIAYDEAKEAEL